MSVQPADTEPEDQRARTSDWRRDPNFRLPIRVPWSELNAGNHGFNMVSKYPRADYVCLAQREFQLETRSRRMTPDEMVRHVADRLACPRVMMTQGSNGTLFYTAPESYHRVPALATKVVDRVGAGERFAAFRDLHQI